jgi:hypothetical protein
MVALLLASAPLSAEPLRLPTAIPNSCVSTDPKEILICGSREHNSRYRLPKVAETYDRRSLRAETELAPGLHASAHVNSVELPGGVKSNRVLLSIGIGF